jgi:tryptophan synthase alpha chain
MNRIDKKFKELKKLKRKAFIAFITAGYPSLAVTEKLIYELADSGVDIIELGVPFSDPMADGPIIQEASQRALEKHVHLEDILRLVKSVRKRTEIPICLMSYYNPIFCFGDEKFALKAKDAGVDGVIVADLPPEEAGGLNKVLSKSGINNICFLSPTSTIKRIKLIGKAAKGFIYYVALTGVTGPRDSVAEDLKRNIKTIKRYVSKPVCAGFGVCGPKQVREINQVADGVIVGRAIIRKIKENISRPDLVKRVGNFVRGLTGYNM